MSPSTLRRRFWDTRFDGQPDRAGGCARSPGNADVNVDQLTGQPVLQIKVKQDEIARYGVSAAAVLDLVESVGGLPVGEVYEDQLRFPLVVRLPDATGRARRRLRVFDCHPSGEQIPLGRLASVPYRGRAIADRARMGAATH